jgi:hypothetical protein
MVFAPEWRIFMKLHCAGLAFVPAVLLCITLRFISLDWVAGRDSSVGIATCQGLDCPGIRPDGHWDPPSLLYAFPWVGMATRTM